jgi:hypothetical protein
MMLLCLFLFLLLSLFNASCLGPTHKQTLLVAMHAAYISMVSEW